MRNFIIVVSLACGFASAMLLTLGLSYDLLGHGLHPIVAYPMSTMLLVFPIAGFWRRAK